MISVFEILGGLALFMFGVRLLSTGMEKLAGNRLQEWLDRLTNKPLKGAAFGAIATALIQSSSLLMVTMLGLINANLMTLEQAVGVMMGQEIGTTLTAQIVAFKIGDFCFLFIAIGFILIEFTSHRWQQYGEIILGFGILFLGMDLMSGALKVLTEIPAVADWLMSMGQNPLAAVLAGTVVTAVVQSSSAMTGLVVAMGMSNAITLPGAIALILGANIGTCIDTQFIASLRLARASRRAAVAQTLINVIGVLLFLPFLSPFADLVSRTSPDLARQIANAHTTFNITVSVVLFPFVKLIARAAEFLVPKKPEEEKPKLTAYIDERLYRLPPVALTEALKELIRIGEITAEMIERSRLALIDEDMDAAQWVLEQESELIDPVCVILENFVNTLMQGNLSVKQQSRCFQLRNLLTDIERVGDMTEDLSQAAQKKVAHHVVFSPQATEELDRLCKHTHRTYTCAVDALQSDDKLTARRACRLEDEFDQLYLEARQGHIDRLAAGVCQPEADVIFIESLRNLERISDHADNLGISVMRN
ncbi:MAG: Na/Pi cotransporter family protein [Anaerolineae bacterium]